MISVCGSPTQQTHRNEGDGSRRRKEAKASVTSLLSHSFAHSFIHLGGSHDHKELTPLSPPLTKANNEVCGKGYSTQFGSGALSPCHTATVCSCTDTPHSTLLTFYKLRQRRQDGGQAVLHRCDGDTMPAQTGTIWGKHCYKRMSDWV